MREMYKKGKKSQSFCKPLWFGSRKKQEGKCFSNREKLHKASGWGCVQFYKENYFKAVKK